MQQQRTVFSVSSVSKGYKKGKQIRLSQSSFETPASQIVSLGAGKSRDEIKASELLSAVPLSWKSGCEEKTVCVL
jgi:hypothetical protein